MAGLHHLDTGTPATVRHLSIASVLLVVVAMLDAVTPWGLNLSSLYFFPVLYVGLIVAGRSAWVFISIAVAVIFLVPALSRPISASNPANRLAGVAVGLSIVTLARHRGRNLSQLRQTNRELLTVSSVQKAEIEAGIRELQDALQARQRVEQDFEKAGTFSEAVLSLVGDGVGVASPIPEPPYIHFSLWNDRMEEITGYGMDQINQVGWYEAVYRDKASKEASRDRTARVMAGENLIADEREIWHRDGTPRTVHISTLRLEHGNGEASILGLIQDITDRKQADETIAKIIEAISPSTGQNFFESLVNHLSQACGSEFALIAELDPATPHRANTIAASHQGRSIDSFAYDLRNTPCDNVVSQGFCHFPKRVVKQFPQDPLLVEMGIDSYMGVPLFASTGQAIGLIVLLHTQPLENPQRAETILRVVAARASSELEREQVQRRQRISEQRLRSFFDAATVILSIIELDGDDYIYVECNTSLANFFHRTPEELAGQSARRLGVPESDIARWVDLCERCVAEGKPITTEYPLTRDGEQRWYHGTISYIGPGDRGPQFSLTTVDVTDQKRNEEKLLALAKVVETSGEFIAIWTPDQQLTYLNEAGRKMVGLKSMREALQIPIMDYLRSEDRARIETEVIPELLRERAWSGEVLYRNFDSGDPISTLANVFAIDNKDGKPLAWATVSVNLGPMKKAEQALREREARYRNLVDHASDALFLQDAEARVIDVNRQACDALGYSREELIGMLPKQYDPDAEGELTETVLAQLNAGESVVFDSRHQRKDGSIFPVEVRIRPFWVDGTRYGIAVARDITRRKQAEEASREREARLRALFDQAIVGIAVADTTGRFLRVNDHFCELLGYANDELQNLTMQEVTHPDDLMMSLRELQKLKDGGAKFQIEKRYLRKDGSMIWAKTWVNGIRDGKGDINTVAAIVIDITEQKAAQDALRESEARLQLALTASRTGVWEWDIASDKVFWSPEVYEVIGVSNFGGTSGDFFKLVHPDDREMLTKSLERLFDHGDVSVNEFRIRNEGRADRWMVSSSLLQRDNAGKPVRLIGTVRDITERKQAEISLKASEARLRTLLESLSNVAVKAYDSSGTITFWNQACEKLYGYTAAEAIGQNLFAFLQFGKSSRQERERELSDQTVVTGQPRHSEEFSVMHRDGRQLAILANRVLHQLPGKPAEIYCFDVDVTVQKKAAEELAVRQAELLHSSRLAVVGEMVAALSHEVAQPLSAIGNFADASMDLMNSPTSDSNEKLQEYLSAIVVQIERCGAIIKQLRDFSRRSRTRLVQSDLNDLLRQSADLVANELRWHGVDVSLELSGEALPVLCDSVQIQQVVINLLANARDAVQEMPVDRKRIIVRSAHLGLVAQVEVEDHGAGLTPEAEKRLFEPFFSTKEKGMGIGLSISQTIVEEHEGEIEAVRREPYGTIFRVRMPISRGESHDVGSVERLCR